MKYSINKGLLVAAGAMALFAACTKTIQDTTPMQDDLGPLARVQVYNTALATQRNIVYVDGAPILGAPMVYTQTTASNAAFSGSGLINAIQPGTRSFLVRDTLATATQPPLVFNNSLQANKWYTVFTYDTVTSVKQVTVPNDFDIPTDTTARLRFANFVYQKTGTPPNVDIFSKLRNAIVWSNVAVTQVTPYIPYASKNTDTLIARPTGTTTGLDTLIITPTSRRVYTVVFRGRYATNEAGGALFPRTLTSFINY